MRKFLSAVTSQFSKKNILYLVSAMQLSTRLDVSQYDELKEKHAKDILATVKDLEKCEKDLANSHYKPKREYGTVHKGVRCIHIEPYNFRFHNICE